MNTKKISINYPLAGGSWDEKEVDAIKSVVDSGMHSMGKNVKKYEEEFADWMGSEYALMVNSGSSANLIGFFATKFHSKNENNTKKKIIVPSVSWSTTYFPINQAGYELVFVDVDEDTLNINIEQVKKIIHETNDIFAVCAVNLLGNPCELIKLKSICDQNDVFLIEDNCESFGAMLDGKKTGTFGEFGSFSFFFSHHLCTMEGGMLVTDDEELYHIALALRAHGWIREVPNEKYLSIDCSDFEKKFRFLLPGFNVRPIEMEGAIGSIQLKKADGFIDIRRENAEIFKDYVEDLGDCKYQKENGYCTWFGHSILFSEDFKERDNLANYLMDHGIETRPILAGNFLNNPVLKHLNYSTPLNNYPISEKIDKHGLFFGSHNKSLKKEFDITFDLIKEFLN
tara:strand:- start:19 stop:1212 length:1194 start_codon:yes stop_codon:yes gene_type:complete